VSSARPVVDLTWSDVMSGGHLGLMVGVSAMARKLEDGRSDLGLGRHVEGAIAEMAFAYWLGVPYRPVVGKLDMATGDVARCQVRSTAIPEGSLIVKQDDPPSFPYVLALLCPHKGGVRVRLAGWLDGAEAKDERYWRERGSAPGIHRSAFFVPQSALRPLDTLPLLDDRARRLTA